MQKWFLGRKSTPPVSEILEAVLLYAHLAPRLFGYSFDFCKPSQYPSDKVPFSFNLVSIAFNQKNLNYHRSHPQILPLIEYLVFTRYLNILLLILKTTICPRVAQIRKLSFE